MDEFELGLDSSQAGLCFFAVRHFLNDLNAEVIIRVAFKSIISICGNLILPVGLGDGGANIMRMQTTVGWQVVQFNGVTVLNEGRRLDSIPSERAIYRLPIRIERLRHVLEEPEVVLILMRIKGDLLLFASSWVHEVMGVQVPSLGIMMPDTDSTAKCNINRNILHGLGIECCLKLGAHKSISITWIDKTDEMDSKHCHVECQWYDDQTENPSNHMFGKYTL